MSRYTPVPILLLAALALAGCTKQEEPEGVIPQGYQDALHKAGNVETDLQDTANRQLEQVDAQSQH